MARTVSDEVGQPPFSMVGAGVAGGVLAGRLVTGLLLAVVLAGVDTVLGAVLDGAALVLAAVAGTDCALEPVDDFCVQPASASIASSAGTVTRIALRTGRWCAP
ncbi:MAG TPA: hypothetical protein VHO01_04705 [Jatrophihabitans sp.]|nr:hypothetical protein [Jatrophihabitans sp.]